MKFTNQLLSVAFVALTTIQVSAQNDQDAYRYTNLRTIGTARYQALGGATGALGGDFTSLSTNPAGLAVYRKSTVMASPYFQHLQSESSFLGNTVFADDYNAKFGNAGIVFATASSDQTFAMGFGYNRLEDFQSLTSIRGVNTQSSILDMYLDDYVYGAYWDSFGDSLAWETYLIDSYIGEDSVEYAYSQIPYYGQVQRELISNDGSAGEMVFSVAGSQNNRIYVGATYARSRYVFNQSSRYSEDVPDSTITTDLVTFDIFETLKTRGYGNSFKLGLIYRISDEIRVGYAYHSPTWIKLKDVWSTRMESSFFTGDSYSAQSPEGVYNYKLLTPANNQFSFAYLFGKRGLISAEYGFKNFGKMRLRPNSYYSDYTFDDENQVVQTSYGKASTFSVGGELRFDHIQLRAGFRHMGSGIVDQMEFDQNRNIVSAGIGYRNDSFFADGTISGERRNEEYYMYSSSYLGESGVTQISRTAITGQATVGFRF